MTGEYLSRKEAARFLTREGCPITHKTLANLASNNNQGGGPPFTRSGWKSVHYKPDDLKAWAAKRARRVE